MIPVQLRSRRLTLRPPAWSDAERLTELIGDYDVAKMLSVVPHPYAMEDAHWWLNQIASEGQEGECAFAIDDGSGLIGAVSLGRPGAYPILGYWLGRPYWGQGYMTEAASVVLDWFFATSGLHAIRSGALVDNPMSMNVLEKLGFRRGEQRELHIRARGETMLSNRVSLLRKDFFDKGAALCET